LRQLCWFKITLTGLTRTKGFDIVLFFILKDVVLVVFNHDDVVFDHVDVVVDGLD